MSFLNPFHIVFFAAIALAVLGPKRFPEFTRALGNGMREFRDVLSGASLRPDPAPETVTAAGPAAPPAVPAPPASDTPTRG
jgi:Sec-independent protein translocase protein TatA